MSDQKKRKRTVISIDEKYTALKRIDNGVSQAKVAADLGVGTSTVNDWVKKRKEIEKWCSTHVAGSSSSGTGSKKTSGRKTMKEGEHTKVSEALYVWFLQKREQGIPITSPLLQEKALKFYNELEDVDNIPEEEKFTASNGWLFRWKRRYGVRQLRICGERLSAQDQKEELDKFKRKFFRIIEKRGLTGDQIYNADETGLNFRMLPRKTLVSETESAAPGYKMAKERITILGCSNVTGTHKLKLVAVGKSKNPRV